MSKDEMTDKERIAKLESEMCRQSMDIRTIFEDIREIKDKLLNRPSWAVSIIITFLSTVCVSLIVLMLNK